MQHPALIRKLGDGEFQRRHSRFSLAHLLTLMPLLCLAVVSWGELGPVLLKWVPLVVAVYLAQLAALEALLRREILAGMRREGLVGEDYRPPVF